MQPTIDSGLTTLAERPRARGHLRKTAVPRPAVQSLEARPSRHAVRLTPFERCPVESHNEWDPLEEVIVGRLEGATIPSRHALETFKVSHLADRLLGLFGGRRYPRWLIGKAQSELDQFIHILQSEGVFVRRPEALDFSRRYATPRWRSRGFCTACPRDGVLVVGRELIEAPMAWRSRYFEMAAYRRLFKEYFANGARWTAAPRPELDDRLYDRFYRPPPEGEPLRYAVTEFEPVFDAADFVRCGRDIFCIRSNVTNRAGITWLRRHLGDGYRVHEITTTCRQPRHIDTTFMPLAPGKLLVNPDHLDINHLPRMFKHWDVLVAPRPDPVPGGPAAMASTLGPWIRMNVLMLDERRVIVERSQPSMFKALKDWGFKPIACRFLSFAPFGGSFHGATLDVRRRGVLQSYF